MASLAGLALRTNGERAHDRASADGELADIEAAERDFLTLIDRWAATHDGDRSAISGYLENFLCDYFHERRRAAIDELGDEANTDWETERARRIVALANGRRL